jgi:hypothetical protein
MTAKSQFQKCCDNAASDIGRARAALSNEELGQMSDRRAAATVILLEAQVWATLAVAHGDF